MQLRRRRVDRHARPGPLQGSGHCGDGAVHALYLPRLRTWPRPLGRGRCSRENVSGALRAARSAPRLGPDLARRFQRRVALGVQFDV
jgi:hypothetical protein